jgi:hypothetical protein
LPALEHIRRMRGGTQPQLMRTLDNSYYVVKFQNNPQGIRILANDFLGTRLSALLGLPAPKTAILSVDSWLIEATDNLRVETRSTRIPFKAGLQFGSRFPTNPHFVTVLDFLPDPHLKQVQNVTDFLGMLVFDKWTCNTDGRQTIFYRKNHHGPYRTEMIDQGWCFNGQEWNFPDAPRRGLYTRPVVYENVRGIRDFEPWLDNLKRKVTADCIWQITKNIPPEWYEFDSGSLHRLCERLDSRRARVPELIWSTWKESPEYFPHWNCSIALGIR